MELSRLDAIYRERERMEFQDLVRCYYDTAELHVAYKAEGGQLKEETIKFAHKPIDRAVWKELMRIGEEKGGDEPADVRQLVFLDLYSKDITEGGKTAELSAERLSGFNEVLRARIIDAIVPNARRGALWAAAEDFAKGDGRKKKGGKGAGDKSRAAAKPRANTRAGKGAGVPPQPLGGGSGG